MVVFFVKSNENTNPKGRALMQMYRVVPTTKQKEKSKEFDNIYIQQTSLWNKSITRGNHMYLRLHSVATSAKFLRIHVHVFVNRKNKSLCSHNQHHQKGLSLNNLFQF